MHVKNVKIQNFKSIKELEFEAKKVNVFIGRPNTGKSNILEVFNIFSLPYDKDESHIGQLIRMRDSIDIVFNKDKELVVNIKIDELVFRYDPYNQEPMKLKRNVDRKSINPFKFYKFDINTLIHNSRDKSSDYLLPKGENLPMILLHTPRVGNIVSSIFSPYRIEIVLKQGTEEISFQKRIKQSEYGINRVLDLDYTLLSDTLLRMMFYYCAVLSNKDSIIVFEEPETKSFPEYIKRFARIISDDENNNQFFIATHNPYLLTSLIEKTSFDNLNVIITEMNDMGETYIRTLTYDEVNEILDDPYVVFFNLEDFLNKKV